MRFINRGRFVRGSGFSKQTSPRKHISQVTFTDEFNIFQVVKKDEITIEGDFTNRLVADSVFLIDGSTNGENDEIWTVKSSSFDETHTLIKIKAGKLKKDLTENGQLHLAKSVTIKHFFETKAFIFSLRNMVTGNRAGLDIADKAIDDNTISLTPQVPILDEYLVIIIA